MEQQGRRAIGRVCPRGAESYTWQEGDTAERIARTYATTVQALQVINPGVDFATLTAGEEICLPNFIYTCISGQPYVVEDGDTFASIAARLGITTFELAERNPGVSQNNLTVGQVLCVPAKADDADDAQTPAIPLPDDGEYPALPDDAQTPVIPLPDAGEYPALPDTPTRVCPSGYTLSAVQSGQSYADLLVQHNVSYRAMRSANPQLMPGYLIAGTLSDGSASSGYGGGTCQVSSTLYNALLQLPGINILYRRAHGEDCAPYLPHGVDAAVGNKTQNLRWRNDYDFPIRVEAHTSGDGALCMLIYRVYDEK